VANGKEDKDLYLKQQEMIGRRPVSFVATTKAEGWVLALGRCLYKVQYHMGIVSMMERINLHCTFFFFPISYW
jgi:hypothetical protein